MLKKQTPLRAFTIAELVLVVAVIGVLFGIGTRTYRNERDRFVFNDSLSRILNLIKTARDYAITSRSAETPTGLVIPREGYGVHINRTSGQFTLFANLGPDVNRFEGDAADPIEETYTLPSVTVLHSFLKDNKDTPLDTGEALILFRPPFAETFISNNGAAEVEANLMDTLYLRLVNQGAPEGAPASFIFINRVSGFPELELP